MSTVNWERLGAELAERTKEYVGKVREALTARIDVQDIARAQVHARLMALETVVRERDAQIRDLEARVDMRDAVASVHNG